MIEATARALIDAIGEGNANRVRWLLRAGASPNAANEEGTTPLDAGVSRVPTGPS